MRGDEERVEAGRGADHQHQVSGLEALDGLGHRIVGLEAPVGRLALGQAQGAVVLGPAAERRQLEAARDDPIDVLEEKHLGEQVLALSGLELAYRFVPDPEQLFGGAPVFLYSSIRWRRNS